MEKALKIIIDRALANWYDLLPVNQKKVKDKIPWTPYPVLIYL